MSNLRTAWNKQQEALPTCKRTVKLIIIHFSPTCHISSLTSIYSQVHFVVKKSITLHTVTIFNILSTCFYLNFSHGNSQIYFVSLGKIPRIWHESTCITFKAAKGTDGVCSQCSFEGENCDACTTGLLTSSWNFTGNYSVTLNETRMVS